MKTVFLLNPKAGKGRGLDKIKEAVARETQRNLQGWPLWRLKLKERKSGS